MQLTTTALKKLPQIAEGGEAMIYDLGSKKVLKIFKPHIDMTMKRRKIEQFAGMQLPNNVTAPIEVAEINGKTVGYVMSEVRGDEFRQLTKNAFVKANKISNRTLLEILINFGKTLQPLHGKGIVIGDISDNNALVAGNNVYFIDVDSYGVAGLSPDAYTEIFTAPECYQRTGMTLTQKTDMFSFAVLAFNTLARLHPFRGTLERAPAMTTTDRIRQGLSVLGKENITILKSIPSWEWLSPDLKKQFTDTFEANAREDITTLLEDQLKHSKLCKTHGVYYYDRYTDCPLCSGAAKVIAIPVITKVQSGFMATVVVLFEAQDVSVILGRGQVYLNNSGEIVHIATGRKRKLETGTQVNFTDDGKFAIITEQDRVKIFNENDLPAGEFARMRKSAVVLRGSKVYFIDTAGQLTEVNVTPFGNTVKVLVQAKNALFSASNEGKTCVVNQYGDYVAILVDGRSIELSNAGKITEYCLRYDKATDQWLFVYQLPNGRHRTVIIGKTIEYDSDSIGYVATPLSGICFANGTIFEPTDGKIVGTNPIVGRAKEFVCAEVNATSHLELNNGKFTIVNSDRIYQFG